MRDDIFRLKSECTCQICYNPICTQLMGSTASYDLFRYWLMYNDYFDTFKQNRLFYRLSPDNKFYTVCRACFKNRRITSKHISQRKTTGKYPYPIEYSMTKDKIKDIWSEFLTAVKNKKWLLNVYNSLANLRRSNFELWNMYFIDIFFCFHNIGEPVDVYELEEFSTFRI